MAAIGALISLFPIFSDFLIGPNWLDVLLSTELGFLTLTLLLIASYAGAIFMLVILISMMRSIYSKIVDNNKYSDPEKIASSVLMLIGAVSIFASVLFLLLIWIVKFDFAIYYNLLIIILIGETIAVVVGFFILLSLLSKYIPKPIAIIILLIIIASLCFFIVLPITVDTLTNISHYYSDKPVIVKINVEDVNQNNNTPVLLLLNRTIDAYFTKNLSIFDEPYAQCHWSTNYGYFFTITSNNSVIKRHSQELIIQGCDLKNKIYWTYDIGDLGKNKPLVLIGMTLEDRNKKENYYLGDAHLNVNWTDTDTIKFDDESLSIFK